MKGGNDIKDSFTVKKEIQKNKNQGQAMMRWVSTRYLLAVTAAADIVVCGFGFAWGFLAFGIVGAILCGISVLIFFLLTGLKGIPIVSESTAVTLRYFSWIPSLIFWIGTVIYVYVARPDALYPIRSIIDVILIGSSGLIFLMLSISIYKEIRFRMNKET